MEQANVTFAKNVQGIIPLVESSNKLSDLPQCAGDKE